MINKLTNCLDRHAWERVEAGHLHDGGPPALIASRRNDGQASADLAADLLRELQWHCDTYGGIQRYQIALLDSHDEWIAVEFLYLQAQVVERCICACTCGRRNAA